MALKARMDSPVTMLGPVIDAILLSVDEETSETPERLEKLRDNARREYYMAGQCHVVSLVLRDYFNAQIYRGLAHVPTEDHKMELIPHYWVRIPGLANMTLDLTRAQFPPATVFTSITNATREKLNSTTKAKYELLRTRVRARMNE